VGRGKVMVCFVKSIFRPSACISPFSIKPIRYMYKTALQWFPKKLAPRRDSNPGLQFARRTIVVRFVKNIFLARPFYSSSQYTITYISQIDTIAFF
jgi:hypothetical protein